MKTRDMIICAIFAAVLCIFSVMTIPIALVPFSMAVFGILLTSYVLGAKRSIIAVVVFILLGAIGLPVFSGFRGGVSVLAGPTGGYITAYIFTAWFVGYFTSKLPIQKIKHMTLSILIMFVGVAICYLLGTVQFMFVQKTSFAAALTMCVYPFIIADIIKCVMATVIGYILRRTLSKTGLLGS